MMLEGIALSFRLKQLLIIMSHPKIKYKKIDDKKQKINFQLHGIMKIFYI